MHDERFREHYLKPEDGDNTCLRNAGTSLPDYEVSQPRILVAEGNSEL